MPPSSDPSLSFLLAGLRGIQKSAGIEFEDSIIESFASITCGWRIALSPPIRDFALQKCIDEFSL